ncbi:MAG: hypothetical protein ACKO0Z_25310 [Betaproteobacteria bacterium]
MSNFHIYKHPEEFKSGIRVLKLVSRNKDNAVKARNRVLVSTSPTEFDNCLAELTSQMQPGQRVYASTDERNPHKALRIFKQRQLDNDYQLDVYSFYHNAKSVWASCLEDPSASFTKRFLFDLDTLDEQTAFWDIIGSDSIDIDIAYKYQTKSGGYHVITNPFNHTLLPAILTDTRKTNASILWAYDLR